MVVASKFANLSSPSPAGRRMSGPWRGSPRAAWVLVGASAMLTGALACSPKPVATLEAAPAALELPGGAVVELAVKLRPSQALLAPAESAGPILFVHLNDGSGKMVRTFDRPIALSDWRPEVPLTVPVDLYQSALGPSLPAGSYTLSVGLYQPGGKRFPLVSAAPRAGREEYQVATVTVPATDPVANFGLDGPWSEPIVGHDIQVLERRVLTAAGAITVSSPAGGTVVLGLEIPEAPEGGSTWLAPGTSQPSLTVRSSCNAFETVLSGAGRRTIGVPVSSGNCILELLPDYAVVDREEKRQAVILELLGLRAGNAGVAAVPAPGAADDGGEPAAVATGSPAS